MEPDKKSFLVKLMDWFMEEVIEGVIGWFTKD